MGAFSTVGSDILLMFSTRRHINDSDMSGFTCIHNQSLNSNTRDTCSLYNVSKFSKYLLLVNIPTSNDAQRAPRDRKNEYMVIVSVKMNRRLMKNCDGVRERFAMLDDFSSYPVPTASETHKYTTMSKRTTWTNTSGTSTTTCASA